MFNPVTARIRRLAMGLSIATPGGAMNSAPPARATLRTAVLPLLSTAFQPQLLVARRAATVAARVRVVAAVFAVLTLLWIPMDLLLLDRATGRALGGARVATAAAFIVLALVAGGVRQARGARFSVFALIAIPSAFFAFAATQWPAAPDASIDSGLRGVYASAPFVIAAGLALFPLTALEALAAAAPIFLAEAAVIALGVRSLTPMEALGSLWLLLLVTGVAGFAGMAQVALMSQLLDQLSHDPLTGAYRRATGEELLGLTMGLARRSEIPLAMLFIDLDRFKGLNDALGHPAGDEFLKVAADRLVRSLRRTDAVARVGGDEFLVMIQDVTRDHDPARVAEKLIQVLSKPCLVEGREYRVGASVGIAVYPRDGIDPHVLIRNADVAMYHAKAERRSGYSYHAEGMNERVAQRLELESRLREAVERQSFVLHYQPQIDVDLGEVVGAEALLRWRDPGGGLVSPASFVPLAEETGMINAIGRWVLARACADATRWRRDGRRPPRVAVNVSSRQLVDPAFSDFVAHVLRESGLEPGRLDIEITESSVLQERGITTASVRALRQLGTRVTIDDFGTGYSALSALKNLPVDGLKIDRSFVAEVTSDAAAATIATALVSMASGLGIEVTAEGIATPEQARFLYDRGCRTMQGYLFGKPVPCDELVELFAAGRGPWDEVLDWILD